MDKISQNAKAHWDNIAKPIDSLGLLEDYVVKLCRISGSDKPYELDKKALVILCGDHGVVAEGVTQIGSEVTRIVSENFTKGNSCVNQMADVAGVDIFTIDIGMLGEKYPDKAIKTGAVIDRKVGKGTRNLANEAAMSTQQCQVAIQVGIDLVAELKAMGYKIIATGEMGIGNTTPTSALAAAFLGLSARDVVGRGAGLSSDGITRKLKVVEQAVARVRECDVIEPVELLAQLGGYELAGMVGLFLGGVKHQMPIVIDGAISAVSAMVAGRIDSRVRDYALASHISGELTGKLALDELGLKAIIDGGLRLGEGSGAVALFPLLDMAMAVYKNMGSFEDYDIATYERYEQ